jgi:hypothetical protein
VRQRRRGTEASQTQYDCHHAHPTFLDHDSIISLNGPRAALLAWPAPELFRRQTTVGTYNVSDWPLVTLAVDQFHRVADGDSSLANAQENLRMSIELSSLILALIDP